MQHPAENPHGRAPAHLAAARFFDAHPWIVDGAGALLLAYFVGSFTSVGVVQESMILPYTMPVAVQVATAVAICLPVAVRRVWPVAAASVTAGLCLLSLAFLMAPNIYGLAVPIMVYSVSAYRSQRWGRVFLGIGLAGAVAAGIYYGITTVVFAGRDGVVYGVLALVFCAVCVVLAWLLGDVKRRRRREIDALATRNRLLLRQREQETRMAADAERMRIAREMHDIVAHSTSVMIAQADGGRFVLAAGQTEQAEKAFATIAETGRDSLDQMRRMLGVLRNDEARAEVSPLPDIGDLPQLIADVRAAGLPVSLIGSPHAIPPLPEGGGLAVYRVVQEALTNTLKHAGPGAEATVRLRTLAGPPRLRVTIDDTGQGPADATAPEAGAGSEASTGSEVGAGSAAEAGSQPGGGSGLVGMRERALMLDGSFSAARDGEGFHVAFEIPIAGTTTPSPPPPPLTGQLPAVPAAAAAPAQKEDADER